MRQKSGKEEAAELRTALDAKEVLATIPAEDLKPWDRFPCDSDESWEAFQLYLSQRPPRRLYLSPHGVRLPINKARKFYTEGLWAERARAFDTHCAKVKNEEIEALVAHSAREIMAEHLAMLADAREVLGIELEKLLAQTKGSEYNALKPRDLTNLLDAVIKFDRLLKDQATEKVETTLDLSKLSLEEIRELERLQGKLYADLPGDGADIVESDEGRGTLQ